MHTTEVNSPGEESDGDDKTREEKGSLWCEVEANAKSRNRQSRIRTAATHYLPLFAAVSFFIYHLRPTRPLIMRSLVPTASHSPFVKHVSADAPTGSI